MSPLGYFLAKDVCFHLSACWKEWFLFDFFSVPPSKSNQYYITNLIPFLAKDQIHKCKFSKQKPCFLHFEDDFKQYIQLIN